MADFRVMGGGVETDMISGRPKDWVAERQIEASKAKQAESVAVQEAAELAVELENNPQLMQVLGDQYLKRLEVLASKDAVCKSLEVAFNSFNFKLKVAPILRKKATEKAMGPLKVFYQEPEAAP